jgi:GNAT superfamily N-acetyltransferase
VVGCGVYVLLVRRLRIRPLERSGLVEAGGLLARRHAAHRIAQPLLSARFEDPALAHQELADVWSAEGAGGAVAVDDTGHMVGYLLGATEPGSCWGPNAWIESAGHAADDPEIIRDLYGLAAAGWAAEGRTAHYVLVPAHDRGLIDAWFRLGFGAQQVHAVRALTAGHPPPPTTVTIRPADHTDLDTLIRLDLTLPDHQARSPVFSAYRSPADDQIRAEWQRKLPDHATFVAERDGQIIGCAVGCALTHCGMDRGPARPDNAAFIGFAAVFPHARGTGAGRALGQAIIGWATDAGYTSIVTDWRSANLLSSRTWPHLGFTPTFLRLHRHIGY